MRGWVQTMIKLKYGVDISKWNDSSMISKQDFCILRAGYGAGHEDKKFKTHLSECRKHGIPVGVYWFSYALTEEGAKREAEECVRVLDRYGVKPEYPVYFDFEYDSWDYFSKNNNRSCTNEDFNKLTEAFCSRLEELGFYAGVYVNKDYFKKYKLGDKYTIWLADYHKPDFKGRPSYVHMLQYTSVPYDKDACKVDFPKIIKKAGLNGW